MQRRSKPKQLCRTQLSTRKRKKKESEEGNPKGATSQSQSKCDVVIDGMNVATEFERGEKIRVERIERALQYFEKHDKNAVAIIPDHFERENPTLMRLVREGRVRKASDIAQHKHRDNYEDYVLRFALKKQAHIISNNMYKKSSLKLPRSTSSDERSPDDYLVPFTFIKRRFLPNPSSRNLADKSKYTTRRDHRPPRP